MASTKATLSFQSKGGYGERRRSVRENRGDNALKLEDVIEQLLSVKGAGEKQVGLDPALT